MSNNKRYIVYAILILKYLPDIQSNVTDAKEQCKSAGRIYDLIGKKAHAKVEFVTPRGAICKICKKDIRKH